MAKLLHSVAVQERAVSADSIEVDDLAVNPLSVVLIALRPLNATGTLSEFASYLTIMDALNRVSILFRGQSIFSMSGRDAAALNYFRHGIVTPQANHDDADDERRCVVLPVLLGKFAYDPVSCFPASRRGELTLEMDVDVADTGYDGFRVSVETVELLDAKPKEYERKTSVSETFGSTGLNDIDLPIGRRNRGILGFSTTGFGGSSPSPGLGRMSVRLNNVEEAYAATDFEVAHTLGSLMGRQPPIFDNHTHRTDTSGSSATQESAGGPINIGSGGWQNYCFLDLDPTRDDAFSLDTSKATNFALRVDAESAEAVRAVPIEQVIV